jgi:predicted glycosyltransferase
MKILFDLGHPAHAHFFRYIIQDLQNDGHDIEIAARKREMLFYLLDRFGLDYTEIGQTKTGLVSKAADMLRKDLALLKLVDKFQPDLMMATGSGSPYSAQVAKLKNIPNITCTDTEHATFINWLTLPFTSIACTPDCYTKKLKVKYHVKYPGYHELAYLHPDRYKPSSGVLDSIGAAKDENLILVKLAQWTASHDVGVEGFNFKTPDELEEFIGSLERFGRVMVSSEIELPAKLRHHEVAVPQEQIHHLLAKCSLYLGEGATMASEAAVLGVPSIFISTLRLGYLDELQDRYDLAFSYSSRAEALEKALDFKPITLKIPGRKSVKRCLKIKRMSAPLLQS